MSEDCPYCRQELPDSEADVCPHCNSDLEPPTVGRYESALLELEDATSQISSGVVSGDDAKAIGSHITGLFQQILDQAREEISFNLKRANDALAEVPEEARVHWTEYTKRFATVQSLLNKRLLEISELWQNTSPNSLQIQHSLSLFQQDLNELELLVQETSQSALMEIPEEPLPKEVANAIDCFEKTMEHINIYCAGREKADLEGALVHLDEARRLIKLTLMMDAYDE
jgi:hypothetical protein